MAGHPAGVLALHLHHPGVLEVEVGEPVAAQRGVGRLPVRWVRVDPARDDASLVVVAGPRQTGGVQLPSHQVLFPDLRLVHLVDGNVSTM